MAKKKHSDAPEFVEEFEGAADKFANWVAGNAWLVGGTLLAVLAAVWGLEAWRGASVEREGAASEALERTRSAYLMALGAQPGSFEVPELANPDAARAIQEEYLEKFLEVADEHPGTVAGTLARFETAELLDALGREDQSASTWEASLAEAQGNDRLLGMLHQRIAAAHESAEAWAEAAAAHEAAAALEDYPLRSWALVDAGRCWLAAGERARALETFDRVEAEAPDLQLPEHIRVELRELRAAG